MPAFTARYTQDQKQAVAEAKVDHKLTAQRVQELAQAGSLTIRGHALEPFEITTATIYEEAKKLKRRRGGDLQQLAKIEHKDAIQALRIRLIAAAEYDLQGYEKTQRRGKQNPERLRQIIRCVREAASLPGPKDDRPAQPGQRRPGGEKDSAGTNGGLAGSILAAARNTGQRLNAGDGPEQDASSSEQRSTENAAQQEDAATAEQGSTVGQHHGQHGSRKSEHVRV